MSKAKKETTKNSNNSDKILAGLFKAGIKVYKAASRGMPEVVYTKPADVVAHRKGVRFRVEGGSAFLVTEGIHAGKVCFKNAIPALQEISTGKPAGYSTLVNCYKPETAADVAKVLKAITGIKTLAKKPTKKAAVAK